MIDDLKKLLDLQELDQELARLNEDLRRFAPVLDGVKRDRNLRAAIKRKREQDMATTLQQRRKLETDLKDVESKLARFRQQQENVRTTKEAEALGHEVSQAEAEIGRLEETILNLLDKEETSAAAHKQKLAQEDQSESQAIVEEKRLQTLSHEKSEMIKALQGDRITAANRVGEDLLPTYEWLRKRHGPTAVVRVDGGACAGCGNMLVAQTGFRAKAQEELVQCPNCQRYLY